MIYSFIYALIPENFVVMRFVLFLLLILITDNNNKQ